MIRRFHIPMDEPAFYRITVLGSFDEQLGYRLGDLQWEMQRNVQGEEVAILSGRLQDQAALLGLLVQLYNRGHCLLAVERNVEAPSAQ